MTRSDIAASIYRHRFVGADDIADEFSLNVSYTEYERDGSFEIYLWSDDDDHYSYFVFPSFKSGLKNEYAKSTIGKR